MELQYDQMKLKDSQDIFNKSLDTTEEKMSELGEIPKETIQTETHRTIKYERTPVTCGTRSSDLMYMKWKIQKKEDRKSI